MICKIPDGWYRLRIGDTVRVGDKARHDKKWVRLSRESDVHSLVQPWEAIIRRKKEGAK